MKHDEAGFLSGWIAGLEQKIALLQAETDTADDRWLAIRETFVGRWTHTDPFVAQIERQRIAADAIDTRDTIYARRREYLTDIARFKALIAAYEERLHVIEMVMTPDYV